MKMNKGVHQTMNICKAWRKEAVEFATCDENKTRLEFYINDELCVTSKGKRYYGGLAKIGYYYITIHDDIQLEHYDIYYEDIDNMEIDTTRKQREETFWKKSAVKEKDL